jgi:carbonic anhydrase
MHSDEDDALFDLENAFEYFEFAANKWHLDAQKYLAIAYFNGSGTECNFVEAVKWLVLSEAKGASNTEHIRENFEEYISAEDIKAGTDLANQILTRN